jgi:bifunctional DNA-binding transcriptional regulator/antitoxin component of YhaV-PrlF toxin-antitoxin module
MSEIPNLIRLEFIEADGEIALVLPLEVLERLGAKAGDTLILTPSEGGYLLTRQADDHG